METSSSSDEWCDEYNLRDMDFWLHGYRRTREYNRLVEKFLRPIEWNIGVGPTASFTRTIASIGAEAKMTGVVGPFDHVIKVELRKEPTEEAARGYFDSITEFQLAAAVAEELGLLDQKYKQLKESDEELRYYTYGMEDRTRELQRHVFNTISQILTQLINKRYLLMVDNLYEPIEPIRFPEKVGLPPPSWKTSNWLMSTTSQEVCDRSKSVDHTVLHFSSEDEILMLILSALHQSAKFISDRICQQDEQYWHRVALRCFHYAMLLPVPQHPPPPQEDIIHSDRDHQSYNNAPSITSDELIRQWATQGILTAIKPRAQESTEEADSQESTEEETDSQENTEEEAGSYHNKYNDIHQVGNVILQAFREYSLLQLPFCPATEANAATETAAQFLTYHGLIGKRLTTNKLLDGKEYMEQLKWISFVDHDQGRHVSIKWLSHEITNGPTALILRGCSHQLSLFSQFSSFLPKLCFLRVLDISYTPLKSLPPSIGCLVNLRLLSLRGCHDLKTLLISSSTTGTTDLATHSSSYSPLSTLCQLEILDMNGVPFSHLTQDMGNQKSNLIFLDMSYSEVTTFPLSFFQDMSNLEMLVLVKCPNLVELPPSMAALLNLTTLEVTGTQIESFPEKIFEEMRKLQSLKLIDNKKLISLPGSISRANGLIELHIEGWQSSMVEEIKLDRHPTLRSFLLIAAPHIKRLFLHGCRKLESVELKDLGALEVLDLSTTAIKELPADIPNLPKLRQMLLMGVPSLKRFPWHKLQRLPDVFCLDHCAKGISNHSDKVVHVCISDFRLFHSFNVTARDLVRDGRFFRSFYVRVAPCNIRQLLDEEGMLDRKLRELVKKQSTYVDVHSSYKAEEVAIFSPMTTPLRRTGRHVEISAMHQYPAGLHRLLQVTRSISVTCDTSISNLYDLSSFDELEECELRWCHQMKGVIHEGMDLKNLRRMDLKNLRRVHASNLKSLAHFCLPLMFGQPSLSTLEHLHLEYCPRLKAMMPVGTALPCLRTLDILFCYNLETIFYTHYARDRFDQLPRLQKIRLQELPWLKHLHEDDAVITAPMWKELHVRGCWSLRRLPHLEDQLRMVEVNGERSWWGKLQWDSPLHRNSYDPKLPPVFASFDERAEIKSYLR